VCTGVLCEVAHPHTSVHSVISSSSWNFEVLEHPPYSPGLAPLDHHVIALLKRSLKRTPNYHWSTSEGSGAWWLVSESI